MNMITLGIVGWPLKMKITSKPVSTNSKIDTLISKESLTSNNMNNIPLLLLISRLMLSQDLSKKLLILMVFLDIKKSILDYLPLLSSLSCLESCLVILVMEGYCLLLVFIWYAMHKALWMTNYLL